VTKTTKWILWTSFLLGLPALLPLAGALVVPYLNGMVPTGFIEYDMPYYYAEGRAYFDRGFQLTYGNPYAGYNSPAIYFQPQTFLLGLLHETGLAPGVSFNLFGLAALFFAAIAAVVFYIEVVGAQTTAKKIGLLCFFWGGGIFTLWGGGRALFESHRFSAIWEVEPTYGWWMLNYGRNLVYPLEAFYHGLFLFALLALMRRRLALSLALATVLCISHPFTGVSLILTLIAYSGVELVLRSGVVKLWFMIGAMIVAALDVAYYLVFLNRFTDHRVLQQQWEHAWVHSPLPWLYPPKTFVAALILVGVLAIWRLATPVSGLSQLEATRLKSMRPAGNIDLQNSRKSPRLHWIRSSSFFRYLRDPRVRLFLVMFVVVFALTQHNLVIRPMQPIHFAHGYDWTALFFLGAPVLIGLIDSILKLSRPIARYGALALLLGLFLLDNAAWLVKIAIDNEFIVSLTKDEDGALNWLSKNARPGDLVICQDEMLSYLVPTYSPALAWQGHLKNTPYLGLRHDEVERVFNQGQALPEWKRHGVIYVSPATWVPPADLSLERRYANSDLAIWATP
jgi:hypothetical protein